MRRKLRKKLSGLLTAVFALSAALVFGQLYQYRQADRIYASAQQIAVSEAGEIHGLPSPVPESAAHPAANPAPSAVEPELEAEVADMPVPLAPEPVAEEPEPAEEEPKAEEETQSTEETLQYLTQLNLDALRTVNDRVLGWIYIPNSPIDYPLLGVENNSEYLYRAWDGTENRAGSIFLECRNSRELNDFNTLIYGHRMGNGSMFGMLSRYQRQDYRDSHPYVYLVTDEGVLCYEVFAAHEAGVTDDTFRLLFADEEEKQRAIDSYLAGSVLAPGSIPGTDDRILTLSTCTGTGRYDTRWVVQAVLTETVPRT